MRDRHSLSAVLLAMLAGICANAQTTGAFEGTAWDPAGLTVPDCRVEILDSANGAIRIVSTGPDGVYFAPGIPPEAYQIKISHPGFRTMSLDNVEARAGYTVRVVILDGYRPPEVPRPHHLLLRKTMRKSHAWRGGFITEK